MTFAGKQCIGVDRMKSENRADVEWYRAAPTEVLINSASENTDR